MPLGLNLDPLIKVDSKVVYTDDAHGTKDQDGYIVTTLDGVMEVRRWDEQTGSPLNILQKCEMRTTKVALASSLGLIVENK